MQEDINQMLPNEAQNQDVMRTLLDISTAIDSMDPIEKITSIIIDKCLAHIRASQGAIFILEEGDRFRTYIRKFSTAIESFEYHLSTRLSGWILKYRKAYLCNNPKSDKMFKGINLSKIGINSILSAPFISPKGIIGMLTIFNKKAPEGFTDEDKKFLAIVGTQTAKVIENARLYEQEKELIKIREEIILAKEIQKRFLPSGNIDHPACEIHGYNSPAKDVGGDYYDYTMLDENNIFVSIGDVVGKGIPAALLMAHAQATIRSKLRPPEHIDLLQIAEDLNGGLLQYSLPNDPFAATITTIFGYLNCTSRVLRFINAGHPRPLIIKSDGNIMELSEGNTIIGAFDDSCFSVRETVLENGDLLFMYTDGITEAANENEVFFEEERLRKLLIHYRTEHPRVIINRIVESVNDFSGTNVQHDDMTMVAIRIK